MRLKAVSVLRSGARHYHLAPAAVFFNIASTALMSSLQVRVRQAIVRDDHTPRSARQQRILNCRGCGSAAAGKHGRVLLMQPVISHVRSLGRH